MSADVTWMVRQTRCNVNAHGGARSALARCDRREDRVYAETETVVLRSKKVPYSITP